MVVVVVTITELPKRIRAFVASAAAATTDRRPGLFVCFPFKFLITRGEEETNEVSRVCDKQGQ